MLLPPGPPFSQSITGLVVGTGVGQYCRASKNLHKREPHENVGTHTSTLLPEEQMVRVGYVQVARVLVHAAVAYLWFHDAQTILREVRMLNYGRQLAGDKERALRFLHILTPS